MIVPTISLQSILILSIFAHLVNAVPLDTNNVQSEDQQFAEEYATLRHTLIYDFGYTKEFADLVEINFKRASKEEKERQKQILSNLRQGNQQAISEEDYDDESTTLGPTTPGASPGDVVRGIAGIVTGVGTLNLRNFWQSFVNFFPPNQREGAQALVDASLGRRPAKWPTLPTTTTKLTTTTKDEDEIDSEETTKAVAVAGVTSAPVIAATQAGLVPAAGTSAPVSAGAAPASMGTVGASVTEAATRAPTTKYMLIRRRAGTASPDDEGIRIDDNLLLGESPIPITITPATTTPLL